MQHAQQRRPPRAHTVGPPCTILFTSQRPFEPSHGCLGRCRPRARRVLERLMLCAPFLFGFGGPRLKRRPSFEKCWNASPQVHGERHGCQPTGVVGWPMHAALRLQGERGVRLEDEKEVVQCHYVRGECSVLVRTVLQSLSELLAFVQY